MKEPCIIQFDDDDNYFTVAEIICYNLGLAVAARAQNIEATRKLISRIENKELAPDIAIVSNYLGNNFEDGRKLAKKLREIRPDMKIIAYVIDPETDWGDELALKSGTDQGKSLVGILEGLTGKKFISSNITDKDD